MEEEEGRITPPQNSKIPNIYLAVVLNGLHVRLPIFRVGCLQFKSVEFSPPLNPDILYIAARGEGSQSI